MVEPVTLRPRRSCSICNKPSTQTFHPFCSNRCAQIDLSRWLGGKYAIPAEEAGQPPPGVSPDERDEEER